MAQASGSPSKRKKYTSEEKTQLLANLDLEVEHRARQFEAWLADALENFRMHQEGLISRVPRLIRDITLRDFAKYNGDVQECLKGIQRERLGGEAGAIDKTTRKRKWVESQEADAKAAVETVETESSKGVKNARMMMATPKKKVPPQPAPGTAQKSRLPLTKTPGTLRRTTQRIPSRAPSPSPHKSGPSVPFPRVISRPGSPSKPSSPSKPFRTHNATTSRVPSSSSFNPAISSTSHPRWPRRDESMLSVNGSPLANPYQLGLGFAGWLNGIPEDEDGNDNGRKLNGDGRPTHKRTNSIIIRSASVTSVHSNGGLHSRSNSQASIVTTSQPAHSRSNANTTIHGFVPTRNNPSSNEPEDDPQSLLPPPAALVSVPTKDGHILELDPLQTTPAEIDALEGITDSAKKQAKADIARHLMQAVERWTLS